MKISLIKLVSRRAYVKIVIIKDNFIYMCKVKMHYFHYNLILENDAQLVFTNTGYFIKCSQMVSVKDFGKMKSYYRSPNSKVSGCFGPSTNWNFHRLENGKTGKQFVGLRSKIYCQIYSYLNPIKFARTFYFHTIYFRAFNFRPVKQFINLRRNNFRALTKLTFSRRSKL